MTHPILIGLTGPAGCGKDTFAKGMPAFHRYALAGPIKRGISEMFSLSEEFWTDRKLKEAPLPWLGKSPRQLAQTLGTEWGREMVDPDLWLKLMQQRWAMVSTSPCPWMVVTDVRFDNEALTILEMGGEVWSIERPDLPPVAGHSSEKGVRAGLLTGVIHNTKDIAGLLYIAGEFTTMLKMRYST